ncbi:MAG TPA: hypothetical protein VG738_03170 [Chitinophagaceae bacterium]|nr:hypothetical protein [Chitinophagaceae bacterium]
MKKIILACGVAFTALAFCFNNFAGAAPKHETTSKYAVNDTIPKKDTTKKDTSGTMLLQLK